MHWRCNPVCQLSPSGSVSHWYFGNIVYERLYGGITNMPCDTCTDFTRYFHTDYWPDTARGSRCWHRMYTPGTYTIALTVNNDTSHKVRKIITFIAPDVLFDTGVSKMRHWSRSRTVFDGVSYTAYPLSDTDFALNVTGGVCTTPKTSFGINYYLSSSSRLDYENEPNPHIYYRGSVIYTRSTGVVTITENMGTSVTDQNTYNYLSNH